MFARTVVRNAPSCIGPKQFQPFIAVFSQECIRWANLHLLGQPIDFLAATQGVAMGMMNGMAWAGGGFVERFGHRNVTACARTPPRAALLYFIRRTTTVKERPAAN
jgi:hypothetical protein